MTAISLVVRLSDILVDEIAEEPTVSYFHHYRTVNYFIDQAQLSLGLLLQDHGYLWYPIPASQSIPDHPVPFSGRLSHKEIAVRAGLGAVGRSGLFLHRAWGPRVRLGTVCTNFIPADWKQQPDDQMNPPPLSAWCAHCCRCIDACPAGALQGKTATAAVREDLVDPAACSSFMKDQFSHIGRGAVCGICMKVCPAGRTLSGQTSIV
jgi:epoxyqueuosine reductase QueG